MLLFAVTLAILSSFPTSLGAAIGHGPDPVVDLGYASYRGFTNHSSGYNIFFGIRFAAPPVGDLRFRAPRPPLKSLGITNATTQLLTRCPQAFYDLPGVGVAEYATQVANISEDCLTLNLYMPANASRSSKLPVSVYVHGGGYTLSDNRDNHPQGWLDLASKNIVSVVPNYRLGLFGFLAGNEVKQDGDLNAGLLDQQFALQWVQKYIQLFGGDPENVTIWGQSAGGGSVLQQAIANKGQTNPLLFKYAIANSPFLPPQFNYNDSEPTRLFNNVVSAVGCEGTKSKLSCLRKKPLPDLADANFYISKNATYSTFTWVPVIDGTFITERASKALNASKPRNGQVILSTHNAWEGILFAPPSITLSNFTSFLQERYATVSPQRLQQILSYYPEADYANYENPVLKRLQAVIQDPEFICPAYWLAEAFPPGQSFKGTWNVQPAAHGQDVQYYFSENPRGLPSYSTFENWVGAIVGVIKQGNPNFNRHNSQSNPAWMPWRTEYTTRRLEKVFEANDELVSVPVISEVEGKVWERCEFWRSIGDIVGL